MLWREALFMSTKAANAGSGHGPLVVSIAVIAGRRSNPDVSSSEVAHVEGRLRPFCPRIASQ